ncbi:MAG: putative lipid II flippase FtsW [Elusimicrobia bacterium]|nr:putative lipid II flippase FtsW [Elusimicrobiota bacterium]
MVFRKRNSLDYTLLAATMALVCWGLVMVYSASAIWAEQNMGNPLYFFKRQMISAAAGLALMAAVSRFNYNRLMDWVFPLMAATTLALVVVLFCPAVAGVKRWIRIGPLGLQPAEFAKLTAAIYLASYLDRKKSKIGSPVWGLAVPIGAVSALWFLISREPDLGTPVLMFSVTILVLFIGGSRVQYLLAAILAALPIVAYELIKYPYRRARLFNFLTPFKDARGAGYQLAQSILAVGSGGWFGKGLGASKLKLMYLPTPHTDFIFPVICEELGLLGALTMLGFFAMILVRGARIARSAPNLFGTLLACGITFTLCLQAFFNVGMSIGLLPTKGIPLPFISYGRSSLLTSLIGIGILLNISRQSAPWEPPQRH